MEKVGWTWPDVIDCMSFINQEQGELASALMKAGYQSRTYKRHVPVEDDGDARKKYVIEMGQLLIMTLTMCSLLNLDPEYAAYKAMQDFWQRFAEGQVSAGTDLAAHYIFDPYVNPNETDEGEEIGGPREYREGF
jgi:hypothetical protein